MVIAAIVLAVVADITSVILLLRALRRYRIERWSGARFIPALTAALLVLPSAGLSIIVGGTFGGGYGDILGVRLGLGSPSPLIPLGIGLGMWLTFATPLVLLVGLSGLIVLKPNTTSEASTNSA